MAATSPTTPPPPSSISYDANENVFYSRTIFQLFMPLSLFYTTLIHSALLLCRPFYQIEEEFLSNDDCFVLPSSATVSSTTSAAAATSKELGKEKDAPHLAIVTGSNTGIGYYTALDLVKRGYHVILACRSRDKGTEAAARINKDASVDNDKKKIGRALFLHPLDLSSFSSVKSFVAQFEQHYNCDKDDNGVNKEKKEKIASLHILVNNAGINFTGTSSDQLDLCFQTSYLGHYLLTRLLLPHLLRARNHYVDGKEEAGRVVNLSSVMHHICPTDSHKQQQQQRVKKQKILNHNDEEWWNECAQPNVSENSYAESKLAALLLTQELNRRFGHLGLRSVAVNPGAVNSDIWRGSPKLLLTFFSLIYLTSKDGARTSIVASIANLPNNAIYLQPYWQPFFCRKKIISGGFNSSSSFRLRYSMTFPVMEMMGPFVGYAITDPRLPLNDGSDESSDGLKSAKALWSISEKIVGL